MADRRASSGSDTSAMLFQNQKLPSSSGALKYLMIPISSSPFQGTQSMVSLDNVEGGDEEEQNDLGQGCCFGHPGKKRRLSMDQVQLLERSFEKENKLEPERKVRIAKEVGLLPRQVAVWFQNRRARFKTKQLEKDFESLKALHERLNADYANLLMEKKNLEKKVTELKEKLLLEDTWRGGDSKPVETMVSSASRPSKPNSNAISEILSSLPSFMSKQKDGSSAKTSDSDSSLNNGNRRTFAEPADSSIVFEADHSDFSQDEEDDSFSRALLPAQLETGCFYSFPTSYCNFGFFTEDQTCLWPC